MASDLIEFAFLYGRQTLSYTNKCSIKYSDQVYDEKAKYFDREERMIDLNVIDLYNGNRNTERSVIKVILRKYKIV